MILTFCHDTQERASITYCKKKLCINITDKDNIYISLNNFQIKKYCNDKKS